MIAKPLSSSPEAMPPDSDPALNSHEVKSPVAPPGPEFNEPEFATVADRIAVTSLIGRTPKTAFTVVVRRIDGVPVVTRNAPLEADGTPMPTRYWLLPSAVANDAIGHLESMGGVRRAEVELDPAEIETVHAAYALERDAALPARWSGPRPSGGVGGTRRGLKCLHAHYANYLAGNNDPVGAWVEAQLAPDQRDTRIAPVAEPAEDVPTATAVEDLQAPSDTVSISVSVPVPVLVVADSDAERG